MREAHRGVFAFTRGRVNQRPRAVEHKLFPFEPVEVLADVQASERVAEVVEGNPKRVVLRLCINGLLQAKKRNGGDSPK